MLTEHFLASIGTTNRKPDTSSATKDAGIFLHEHQPLLAQRHAFKKSACAPNCVAVSRSHVFAAQIDKAVVNVYSREKGNQEATVPFPERITSLTLALDETLLVLGTDGGRIILWETCTGRSLTGPQSHLQPVNVLAVDPTSQFLLSGSSDSNIHVWSLPSLLSFTAPANPTPLHTLSNHRGGVTALAIGHSTSSANIAISASKDNTAIVWDYQQNNLLATYLLGDTPLALTLDAADRGFFATYEDGSMQYIDFYTSGDADAQNSATDSLRDPDTSYTPITPAPSTRWRPTNQDLGAAQSIALSWDGTTILTGHSTGKIASWSPVGSTHLKTILNTLPGPVTNISFLPPTGFPTSTNEPKYKIHAVVKPRLDLKAHVSDGEVSSPVPAAYAFNAQLVDSISRPTVSASKSRKGSKKSAFEEALTHTSFPSELLEHSLAELSAFAGSGQSTAAVAPPAPADGEADFMALDTEEDAGSNANEALERENKELREQLESLQRLQKATLKQLAELKEEKKKSKGAAAPSEKETADGKSDRERKSERLRRLVEKMGD
ncbi:WD repeat containing protein [Lasiodiplodia theobromae]|uniref:WD repeat containing protein n=1 Tax=Lasiodiplodia theobromae TaxID=45133 RepID=UPI0015C2FDA8|nr:WD repeat containing protein [Lasiodiplodia theobromae]KAF4539988.1 WD repeat containing protein [Lasiodiplodia theobromae]